MEFTSSESICKVKMTLTLFLGSTVKIYSASSNNLLLKACLTFQSFLSLFCEHATVKKSVLGCMWIYYNCSLHSWIGMEELVYSAFFFEVMDLQSNCIEDMLQNPEVCPRPNFEGHVSFGLMVKIISVEFFITVF